MRKLCVAVFVCLCALLATAQTTYSPAIIAEMQFMDNNGHPLSGGLIYTYVSGSSTPLRTYSDALGTANRNPVVLDAAGRATIYLSNSPYKFIAKNSAGAQQWTVDPVTSAGTPGIAGPSGGGAKPPYTQSFTSVTAITMPGAAHGYGTTSLITACYDSGVPAHLIEPAQLYVDTVTFDVTVLFAQLQSGFCTINGGRGLQGFSITWLGSFASAPLTYSLNSAYYDSTQKASFVWDGTAWAQMAHDGIPGTGGSSGGGSGITSLDGATQSVQTFNGSANVNVRTDSTLGTHTFSVTGLAGVALSGSWLDLKNIPSAFSPSLPTTSAPGGVFIPVSCPPVTDPLTLAAVPQHVYGIQPSNGQLLCSPDNNWDLQLQVNGTTVAQGVRALNFVGSAGMNITAATNQATGVLTYTVTGSTATQSQSPSFNPLQGAYSGAQNVALSCASPTPTIYYTTNSTTPTHASSAYSAPINISAGTIEAICASSGLADSNLVSAVYSQTAPVAALATSAISFTSQLVGSPSSAISVGLSNTGTAPLIVSSLSFTGANTSSFSQTNNCTTLAVNGSCSVNVVFTPAASGSSTAALNINDNAPTSPQTVSLTGTGSYPVGSATPTTITFASTNVGATGSSQLVTLTNSGTVPMTVSSAVLSGTNSNDFSILANNCLSVTANGGACSVSLGFTPAAGGARTALLSFIDNASNTPQTVSLSGNGLASLASISPASLSFSTQTTSTGSAAQTVTVLNTGTSPLGFSSVGITGANSADFTQSNNCVSVNPSSTCTINVTFTPQATGSRSASLNLSDNAANSPQTVSLSGTGVVAVSIPGQDIPTILLNTPYNYQLVAANGVPPYTWTMTADELWNTRHLGSPSRTVPVSDAGPQTIPYITVPTMAMSSSGLVSGQNNGTPSSYGYEAAITVRVTDSIGGTASQVFSFWWGIN